ncbi:unnamed protein product, partial [Timema podura]|nr:unnamed protein product [Timema podura]
MVRGATLAIDGEIEVPIPVGSTVGGQGSILAPNMSVIENYVTKHVGRVTLFPSVKAMLVLKKGGTALEAVTIATATLEDSPLTNAGYGSTLTWDGKVECDASVMDGRTLQYGAVGAVSGVKNPVKLAHHLCFKQNSPTLALGRVPP